MSIGDRLKEERQRLGKSQTELAALAGTTKKSQIEYEKGATFPNAAYLSDIAAAGADVQYIVTGIRSEMALTPDERELLALYRSASLTGKAAAVGALQGVLGGPAGRAETSAAKVARVTGKGAAGIVGQQFNAPVEGVTQHGNVVKVGGTRKNKKI